MEDSKAIQHGSRNTSAQRLLPRKSPPSSLPTARQIRHNNPVLSQKFPNYAEKSLSEEQTSAPLAQTPAEALLPGPAEDSSSTGAPASPPPAPLLKDAARHRHSRRKRWLLHRVPATSATDSQGWLFLLLQAALANHKGNLRRPRRSIATKNLHDHHTPNRKKLAFTLPYPWVLIQRQMELLYNSTRSTGNQRVQRRKRARARRKLSRFEIFD